MAIVYFGDFFGGIKMKKYIYGPDTTKTAPQCSQVTSFFKVQMIDLFIIIKKGLTFLRCTKKHVPFF